MSDTERVNVLLPRASLDLAQRIAAYLGADPKRGRSAAIRFALDQTAKSLGLSAISTARKKK